MRIKSGHVLCVINILILLLILIIVFIPNNILQLILGLPVVLFFPGYTLLTALFPRRRRLNGIEQLALSFGTSIAVVVFIGLGLNYTPWGIRLYPILISLSSFIFTMSVIAWFRICRLPPEEDIALHIDFKSFTFSNLFPFKSTRDKIITAVLTVAVIGAIGMLIYVINLPRETDKYTEFYVLDAAGKGENYPRVFILRQSAAVIVGIVNHENKTIGYRIEITIDGEKVEEISPINLNSEEKWQQEITFTPTRAGQNQKIVFQLYRGEASAPSNVLNIWIDVEER